MSALILELDPLFLGGFVLPAEVLSERLEKYGIPDDDPYRFVRRVYDHPFGEALRELLPETIDPMHVERRLAATYAALLQQNAIAAQACLRTVIRPLAKRGVRIAAITRLRPDVVVELFTGIADAPVAIFDPAPLAIGLAPEIFQAALVTLGVPVREALALLACGASVRAALRVGLRAVVVPDPMVAFASCAGADLVADMLDKSLAKKLCDRLL